MKTAFAKNLQASQVFNETSACVDKIIWLAAQNDYQCEDFEDACSYDTESILKALKLDIDEMSEADEILCATIDKKMFGFLVQVSVPIPQDIEPDRSSWTHSGARNLQWFYVEDLSKVPSLAKKFAEKIFERQYKKEHGDG